MEVFAKFNKRLWMSASPKGKCASFRAVMCVVVGMVERKVTWDHSGDGRYGCVAAC